MELLTKAAFARRCGVKPPAISRAVKNALAAALVGDKIDAEHPAALDYLRGSAKARRRPNGSGEQSITIPDSDPTLARDPLVIAAKIAQVADDGNLVAQLANELNLSGVPDEVLERLPDMKLSEIATHFRSLRAVHDAIKACKDHAAWENTKVMSDARRGTLIERDMVLASVLPLVDLAFKRCVEEHPETVTPQVVATVKAGGENVEIDVAEIVRKSASQIFKACKSSVRRTLAASGDWELEEVN